MTVQNRPSDFVQRLDTGRIGRVRKTPQGGLRVDAALTRAGVFVYLGPDGQEIREYRPPDEVFKEDSLATLASAPVTNLHPPSMVEPSNFRRFAAGHVSDTVRKDENKVAAELVIQDAALISAVEKRVRTEVSCGYSCRVDDIPGVTPDGEPYDRVQRDITYNHVAIVPKGRAGAEVSLRLDSNGNVLAPEADTNGDEPREENMHSIRIDGEEYPLSTEAEQKAASKAVARFQAKLDADLGSVTAEREKLQARLDELQSQVKDLNLKLEQALDSKRIDVLVAQRAALFHSAAKLLGAEEKLDGLSDRDIMIKAIVKARPETDLEGKSDDYVRARFDALIEAHQEVKSDSKDKLKNIRIQAEDARNGRNDGEEFTPAAARARMIERNRNAWQLPMAFEKKVQQ